VSRQPDAPVEFDLLYHMMTHPDEVLPARETLVPAGETLHG